MTGHHLAAALEAARRGWHVFPLRPNAKTPAIVGWQAAATTDPDRIRRWWTRQDHAADGVAIACGPSGLLVIDCDQPKPGSDHPAPGIIDGLDALAALAEHAGVNLPIDTYTVQTGTGGTHLYYRQPPATRLGNSQGRLGRLIDTRGHGGYVVAAGSTVAGRPYTVDLDTDPAPLPAWLAGLLAPAPLPPQQPVVVQMPTNRAGAYVRAAVAREVERVTTAAKGERNRSLYIAAVALGQLVAGGALAEVDATTVLEQVGVAAGLGTTETYRTVRSGLAAGARRPRKVAA